MAFTGQFKLTIELEYSTFSENVIVADVDESLGIIGIDFMEEFNAKIKIKKSLLKTDKGQVKCAEGQPM